MKRHMTSAAIAIAAFFLLSMTAWTIFRGLGLLYRLEARNEAEQTMNALFTSLRYYDDFGSAIEQNGALKKSVLGIGLYNSGGEKLYYWGAVPERYSSSALPVLDEGIQVRMYDESAKDKSLILILRPSRMMPPPPPHDEATDQTAPAASGGTAKPRPMMLELMRNTDVVYLELHQPEFWKKSTILGLLFPIIEFVLAGLVFFVRLLLIRNREFLDRLEQQRNLVVLGTAASTLAHEIKNPLLAIRLQTSIMEKTFPEESKGEVDIINAEVDRLSRLTVRVNDYLRDPRGFPEKLDPAEIAAEVSSRLCGKSLTGHGESETAILIDPERYRSILENLVMNALESGSDPAAIEIAIGREEGKVTIDVMDRGRGIAAGDKARVFDPFFTTKSKGTGIGLAICDRFAKEAGGVVSLEPRKEGGTRARLTMPGMER